MTSIQELHTKVKANVWQAIAKANLDLQELPQEKLETLVNITVEAALLEMDSKVGQSLTSVHQEKAEWEKDIDHEEILWEGRPFLSITRRYIITDDRVRIINGLVGKTMQNIELIRIQDSKQSQTVGERILNIGDITIYSHDRSDPVFTLDNIQDPHEVHEILRKAVLKARKKHNFSYRQEM